MPSRTPLQSALARLFDRWPGAQRVSLDALDLAYQVALLPFRRARARRGPAPAAALESKTDEYNEAAERYFARFPDPSFLVGKPFSDSGLAAKHLIDAGVLIDAMRLRAGDVVAEIGAGSCWLSHMLNRLGCATVSIDVSSTAIALGRQLFERDPRTNWTLEPRFLTYDGRRLPLADGSCDRIVINDAFHHVPNQRQVMREMIRVLRDDGLVAMSEPGRGHSAAAHSVAESETGVLENELVLEDLAALAQEVGFREATVVVASPLVRHEIAARELGAFMGGKGFARYWKSLCSGLEQHHYLLLHKGAPHATTRRPSRLIARIEAEPAALAIPPGRRARVSVRIANTGDTVWLAGERAGSGWTRLGAHLYHAGPPRRAIDFDWQRLELSHDVQPGAQAVITAELPPIAVPGDYAVVFDLVVEGLTWFADRGSQPAIVVVRVGSDAISR